jgi:hypothetical protein
MSDQLIIDVEVLEEVDGKYEWVLLKHQLDLFANSRLIPYFRNTECCAYAVDEKYNKTTTEFMDKYIKNYTPNFLYYSNLKGIKKEIDDDYNDMLDAANREENNNEYTNGILREEFKHRQTTFNELAGLKYVIKYLYLEKYKTFIYVPEKVRLIFWFM